MAPGQGVLFAKRN